MLSKEKEKLITASLVIQTVLILGVFISLFLFIVNIWLTVDTYQTNLGIMEKTYAVQRLFRDLGILLIYFFSSCFCFGLIFLTRALFVHFDSTVSVKELLYRKEGINMPEALKKEITQDMIRDRKNKMF